MNKNFTIISYDEKYRQEMAELWNICGLIVPGLDYNREIDLKTENQSDMILLGLIDKRVVASTMYGFDGRRGWLNYVAVHPDHRHQNYGKMIIDHAVEKLKDLGCPKVNLLIRKSNSGVVNFYERSGFEINDVICMHKKL